MLLNKQNILNRINQMQATFRVKWEDIKTDLDLAIDKINDYMGTKYPHVTEILNDFAPFEKTYSYRAGGTDVDFFPQKYFLNIVIPFVITQILSRQEEFTTVYSKYLNDIEENLLVMVANEINNVPSHLIDIPKGVYFSNPDPMFKQNPEKYFNRKIEMPVPKIRVNFTWGTTDGFVSRPLPLDFNSYEIGAMYIPPIMQTNDELTLLLDSEGTVMATFVGWSLQPEGEERQIINNYIELKEDLTFYAVWDYDIIRFKYNGNGGALTNWRPLYVNKNNIVEDIYPKGGTAVRVGYKFVGFDPIKIGPDDISNANVDIDMSDGFSPEELEEINDYSEEPVIEFIARWEREKYRLFFSIASENPTEYVYGQEFELLPPTLALTESDSFIGWWDNNEFVGDPITKINESDYGDKTLFAKIEKINYRVTFKNEDGTVIRSLPVPKGSTVEAPSIIDKPNVYIDGLLYSFEFDNFYNGEKKYTENYKINENTEFVATFIRKEVYKKIFINYKATDVTPVYQAAKLILSFHVGTLIKINELVNKLIASGNGYYENSTTLTSYVVNGMSLEENGEPSDDFNMPDRDVDVFSLYEADTITLEFKKKEWDPLTNQVVLADDVVFSKVVPNNFPSENIKNIVELTDDETGNKIYSMITAEYVWNDIEDRLDVPSGYGIHELTPPYNTISAQHIFATEAEMIATNPSSNGVYALVTGFKWVPSNNTEYNNAGYKLNKSTDMEGNISESDLNHVAIPAFNLWDYGQGSVVMKLNQVGIGESYWKLVQEDPTFNNSPKIYQSVNELYLDGFAALVEGVEVPLDEFLTTDKTIVPLYSAIQNEDFVKTLTVDGAPKNQYKENDIRKYGTNTIVNLAELKIEYNQDAQRNKYFETEGFYRDPGFTDKLETIQMLSNIKIYAKTKSTSEYSVKFAFYNGVDYSTTQKVRDIYPFELEGSGLTININDYISSLNYVTQNPYMTIFKGWSDTQGDDTPKTTITLTNTLNSDLILYPVFVYKEGFEIKTNIMYNRTNNFPVTINKTIAVREESALKELTMINLFNGKGIVETLLAAQNSGGLNNPQLRGLEVYEYLSVLYNSPDGWWTFDQKSPMFVGLPAAKEEKTEIEVYISLRRKSNYALVTIESLTGLAEGTTERDLKSFHLKGTSYSSIFSSLPNLLPFHHFKIKNAYGQYVSITSNDNISNDIVIKAFPNSQSQVVPD